ncbi:MAG: hypothetical protein C0501_20630 [Isosphaera sp.]|nr:hypothetical protein [Isosphaera sp.]
MRKDDCVEMFKRIPGEMHQQVNLMLRNGFVVSVETVARFEPHYLVCRGREGGTTDEGRAFFVPYDEICYVRLERVVRLGDLKRMYGETGHLDAEDRLSAPSESAPVPSDVQTPAPTPAPTDPASIAKQNLLHRIRAARANVAGTTGRLGGGGGK